MIKINWSISDEALIVLPIDMREFSKAQKIGGSWGYEPPLGRGIEIFVRNILTGELHRILPPCSMSSLFFSFWEKNLQTG